MIGVLPIGLRWVEVAVQRFISWVKLPKTIAVATMVVALGAGSFSLAQMPDNSAPDAATQPPAYAMSENDLANLVAPIALYPDALLGQLLVASTYPLEVVEAQQWLQQNGNLPGRDLMVAAQQQNWDPSVQALVAFPDVLALLNRDIRWTTDLGNAFLAQQADVMAAIQSLRAEAREHGRLESTPQFLVNTQTQGYERVIEILPADPQIIYVPNYDPYAVWGAPVAGDYPALPYASGSGFGSFFSTVANLAGLLPGFGGLLGPKSWGWALSWLVKTLFVNNSFFNDFGFHNSDGGFNSNSGFDGNGGSGGTSVWVHNAHRRFGSAYGNSSVASWHGSGPATGRRGDGGWRNFSSGRSFASESTGRSGSWRGEQGGWRTFNEGRGLRSNSSVGMESRNGRFAPNAVERSGYAGQFGRAVSPAGRGDRWQRNGGAGRDYFANSGEGRSRSYAGSNSFGSTFGSRSSYNGFQGSGTSRRAEPSRTLTASRSREKAPKFSSGRTWSGREPSFKPASSSGHGSFWKHDSPSHSPKPRHFSAPKTPKPHFAKSHGGGHSSGGHSGKKSHRG